MIHYKNVSVSPNRDIYVVFPKFMQEHVLIPDYIFYKEHNGFLFVLVYVCEKKY